MPNTKSAKKAVRSSAKKRAGNLFWKKKVKDVIKTVKAALENMKINTQDLSLLQKTLDKAAKNKVIHKNRANRLKSKYAKRISAFNSTIAKAGTKAKSTSKS